MTPDPTTGFSITWAALKGLYRQSTNPRDEGLRNLTWDYFRRPRS